MGTRSGGGTGRGDSRLVKEPGGAYAVGGAGRSPSGRDTLEIRAGSQSGAIASATALIKKKYSVQHGVRGYQAVRVGRVRATPVKGKPGFWKVVIDYGD